MKIVGLTGGSGSGKGLVGAFLRSLGCFVVDTDELYHEMIKGDSECTRALCLEFGTGIIDENGGIDRSILADIVFFDEKKLAALNTIAHSFVRTECDRLISEKEHEGRTEIFVVDAPQLFEAGMEDICDVTVAIVSDKRKRIQRICDRDGISEMKANARIDAQHTDAYFAQNCDIVIQNDSDAAHLLIETKKTLDKIKEM